MIEYEQSITMIPAKIICDICKREASPEDYEYYEFTKIKLNCGYVSIFGDGTAIRLDICQRCLKDKLGAYLRRIEE